MLFYLLQERFNMSLVLEIDDYDLDQDSEFEIFDFEANPNSVKSEINRYFSRQNCNEEIISHITESFSEFVSRTSLIDSINIAYKLISVNNYCESTDDSQSSIPEDVRFVINLIHRVQKIVSQDFVGGILVLHLIFIEGLKCDGLI